MKNLKKANAIILLLAMSLLLVACGGDKNTEEPTTDNSKSTTPKSTSTSEKQVEITITHFNIEDQRSSNAEYDTFYTMLEEWQKENPNVKIVQSVLETADYETKIQTQAAVNDLPDLFNVKGSWYNNFVASDLLAPLNDIIDSYEKKDTFRPGVFDASTVGDKIYGLPTQFSVTSLVYYNVDMWKEIGYDTFPDNWDDIYVAIGKFNEKGITPFAFGNIAKWPAESCILSALGDRYTGQEWTSNIIENNGLAKFTDTEFVSALEHFQKFADAGAFNADFNTASTAQAADLYNSGKAATTINGFWEISNINTSATEDVRNNTKIAILPTVDGGKGLANSTSGGAGWYMGMNNQLEGEKKAIVEDLLLHLHGYEYSELMTQKYGLVAPCNAGDVNMDSIPALTREYIELMDTVKLTPIYDIRMEAAVIETMNAGVQELLNGTKDASTLAAEIQANQDEVAK